MKHKKKFWVVFSLLIICCAVGTYFGVQFFSEKPLSFLHYSSDRSSLVFDKWEEFIPQNKDFVVRLPKKPEIIEKNFPIPGSEQTLPYYEYKSAVDEETALSISYTILPQSFLKWSPKLILKGALSIIARQLGGVHLIGKSSNSFRGFPALDYEHHKEGTETSGTLILVENRLYKLEINYSPSKKELVGPHLMYFVDSFNPQKQ